MFRKVGVAGIGAVCVLVALVSFFGLFAVTGRFTPPCPIEALEKAAEDAQATFHAITPTTSNAVSRFQSAEWKAFTEASERLQAAQNGERVEC